MTSTTIRPRTGQQGKLKVIFAAILMLLVHSVSYSQDKPRIRADEDYGHTLNIGVGIGYFGYLDASVPFVFANYEFQVARSFTLAPFIGFASYQSTTNYYYGSEYYYYRETVIPMGVKGTYYFDRLLNLNRRWDLYAAASLGFVYDHVVWQNGYYGPTDAAHMASPLYLDGHLGAEYHFSRNVGVFLDLSTGVSTVGLAFHHL